MHYVRVIAPGIEGQGISLVVAARSRDCAIKAVVLQAGAGRFPAGSSIKYVERVLADGLSA